jgi:hypothetical protein
MADRRTFLSTSIAAGAGALLLTKTQGKRQQIQWCNAPVHPLAQKSCTIYRGAYAAGTVATLTLFIDGPEFEKPKQLSESILKLEEKGTEWPVELSHNHHFLVPGRYEYVVRMTVDSKVTESSPIGYDLHSFTFGV